VEPPAEKFDKARSETHNLQMKVYAASLMGIDGFLVEVEADLARGLPDFKIIGLADTTIKESSERIRAALKNIGYPLPPRRITVSLSPADLRKEGAWFDLPIVTVLLSRFLAAPIREKLLLAGEVGLYGEVKPIRGALPMAEIARREGLEEVVLPRGNAREASLLRGIPIYMVENLQQIIAYLQGEPLPRAEEGKVEFKFEYEVDMGEVAGQRVAKRAVEIGVAGGHNMAMVGPPGAGKTMIAQRIPTVFPPMERQEIEEVTKIYSVAGLVKDRYITLRPFRSPHHTISPVGLIGGGRYPRPGEISLAHRGVLFMDEFTEFQKQALEGLRQPLEEGRVVITRAGYSVEFPSDFMLVAAMNRCEDRYGGLEVYECSPAERKKYYSKISRPLVDRIDIWIELPRVEIGEVLRKGEVPRESEAMRDRIIQAREIQKRRFQGKKYLTNSRMSSRDIKRFCSLPLEGENFLKTAGEKLELSARSVTRVLKLARTIADLEGSHEIKLPHLMEALNYRRVERIIWS